MKSYHWVWVLVLVIAGVWYYKNKMSMPSSPPAGNFPSGGN